jgi:hypothetical protein
VTASLAAAFMVTSILLSILAANRGQPRDHAQPRFREWWRGGRARGSAGVGRARLLREPDSATRPKSKDWTLYPLRAPVLGAPVAARSGWPPVEGKALRLHRLGGENDALARGADKGLARREAWADSAIP